MTQREEQDTLVMEEQDALAMPEVFVPLAEPEAHRGEILSVTLHTAETGSKSFRVSLRSKDTGGDDTLDVWLPALFVADIHVDPATLPDELENRQRTSYSIGVSNSRKDATIQNLRIVAAKAGHLYQGRKPLTLEEFVDAHNELLTGLEIVYTKRPEKVKEDADPRFAGRLRVGAILAQEDAFKPKALKKYRKMWEG